MTEELHKFDDLIKRQSMSEMMKGSDEENAPQMIIAMKGDSYTGKTTCADAIAEFYRCSVVSFDDILLSLGPGESKRLMDHAFDIVLRVAALQLELNRPVVLDSPLSDPSHLPRLLRLVEAFQHCSKESCDKMHCRIVIVECRPQVKYAWQMRFERRDPRTTEGKYWFKPKEWTDIKETPSLVSSGPEDLPSYVSRLYVDTTEYINLSYLGPATLDLTHCDDGHQIDLRAWLPSKPIHSGFNFLNNTKPSLSQDDDDTDECGSDGRHFFQVGSVDLQEAVAAEGYCSACQAPIANPPAYVCLRCGELVLHKSCAELEEKRMIPDPPKTLPRFLLKSSSVSHESIPQEYRQNGCPSCPEFSTECERCLWEMHLRSGLVPTLLHHEGHSTDHPISFWITSALNPREYQCAACKQPGSSAGYACPDEYPWTVFNLHVECALMPRPVRNVHGGYQHDMRMVFGTNDKQEDYLCDVCGEQRDPSAWYYYCDLCVFTSHLHCIYAPQSP